MYIKEPVIIVESLDPERIRSLRPEMGRTEKFGRRTHKVVSDLVCAGNAQTGYFPFKTRKMKHLFMEAMKGK